jgi:transposase
LEYYRHGTLSLFAALNTQTGEVAGQTVPRHTSDAFVDFLTDVVAGAPRAKAIHVILDNLSTHKTQAVRTFLVHHPKVRLHSTPTYSSWLNQVELWFSEIERTTCWHAGSSRLWRILRAAFAPTPGTTTHGRSQSAGAIATRAHRISSTSAHTVH